MKWLSITLLLLQALVCDFCPGTAKMKGMLERHNYWRKEVGVSPLKWSDQLARVAQAWANQQAKKNCDCAHSPSKKFGENIYCSEGMENDPKDVVDDWASEKEYYHPKNGKCRGGECGHYTQIVWKDTKEVGCGMARCGDKEIWVCNYNPPGNFVNQKPY
jgi:pathogenesis-related protein 1